MQLYPEIKDLCDKLASEEDQIGTERKKELLALANDISVAIRKMGYCQITAICTHNSRRSQAAQLWAKTAALYVGIEEVYTYSGGTESTAFNHRMVAAVERAGFLIEDINHFPNPKYHIPLSIDDMRYDIYFSKKYNESYNPQNAFIALLLCDSADEACPIVEGAIARHFIGYQDPGKSDNSDVETKIYNERFMQIGREMMYCFSRVKI